MRNLIQIDIKYIIIIYIYGDKIINRKQEILLKIIL